MFLDVVRFVLIFMLLSPMVVHAATCSSGYYLVNGTCTRCPTGFYCPGNDTRVQCPTDNTDWVAYYTNQGHKVISAENVALYSWAYDGGPATAITHCVAAQYGHFVGGYFYSEPRYNGTAYRNNLNLLWYQAEPGYYLSPYRSTSWKNWYNGVKACTNLPEHAYYTGAGTPDAVDGSVKDANDCPWACDAGYGRHDNQCVPLCSAGVKYIKTGTGKTFNLYPIKYSTPVLVVKNNTTPCYGVLIKGSMAGAININYNGAVYHVGN